MLLSSDSLKPPTQVRDSECAFQIDLLGGTSHWCLKLHWREPDCGVPAFKLKALSFTSCN